MLIKGSLNVDSRFSHFSTLFWKYLNWSGKIRVFFSDENMPDERFYTKYVCTNCNCKHICEMMNIADQHSKPCCKCKQTMSITSEVI